MNMWTSAIFGAVILAVVSAQGPPPQGACGCAPAPVVIQLSCNGGGAAQQPPPPPPPPTQSPPQATTSTWNAATTAGAPHTTGWAYTTDYWQQGTESSVGPDYAPDMCDTDEQGYFIGSAPGGFPPGLRGEVVNGEPVMILPPGYEQFRPSPYWDGTPQTIGFPMPAAGTPAFNMLMCWPLAVPVVGRK